MSDFIRGYFDGDGSIFYREKGRYRVSICGSKTFISELESLLISESVIEKRKSNIVNMNKYGINIYHLRISNQLSVDNFAKYIYREGTFSLARKRELFQKHYYRHANTEIISKETS